MVVAAVAAIGVFVVARNGGPAGQKSAGEVVWEFDQQTLRWQAANGTPPACPSPFKFAQPPLDGANIQTVLLPGAYRGFSYKPHGGFGVPAATAGNVEVRMPMDATLVGLTRYLEGDPADLQYVLTFESDCGIAFRFDHLYTLAPAFQALAEQTPPPKLNDTSSSPADQPPRTKFKAGDLVATRIGLPSMGIYGFDFGVYDYRQPNEISKNPQWAALHNQYQAQEWFGVCWYDMLPGIDPQTLNNLSLQQTDTRRTVKKVSDYCAHTPYQTLDINNGRPTEG